jgi:uncharacterized membrane protein YqjE
MSDQKEFFQVAGKDLLDKVVELVKEGNIRHIVVKDENGKQILDLPLAAGVAISLFLPAVMAIGTLVVLTINYTIEITKNEPEQSKESE